MEPKYIVAIVAVGLFAFLFLIFFILLAHRRRMEAKLQAYLYEVYSDKNLIKSDYDFSDDEVVQPFVVREARTSEHEDYKEENEDIQQLKMEDIYGKIDSEGIEEITGNYKPQN